MVIPRTLSLLLGFAVVAVFAAGCNNDDSVTSANLSVVHVSLDAPATAKSGDSFGVQARAQNAGLAGVHNGRMTITLPAPLTVVSVSAPSGTSATFSNGAAGGTVSWDMGTLDSNSQSKLDITVMGLLAPTEATKKVTILASMTATDINSGDATAQDDVTLVQ